MKAVRCDDRRVTRWQGWVTLATALLLVGCPSEDPSNAPAPTDPTGTATTTPVATDAVELYFPGRDGRLHGERHTLPATSDPAARAVRLVEALVAGPTDPALWPPLPDLAAAMAAAEVDEANDEVEPADGESTAAPAPAGTSAPAIHVYLLDGTIFVDLASPDGPPVVGARQELLMLYSLVNSVLLNTPEARQLVVLWNGRQPSTFAGHIDTAQPLVARPRLIAEPVS